MIRALFLCGDARARGPTAAQIAAQWTGVKGDSAGLSSDADDLLSAEQLDWASIIFVMEPRQKTRLVSQYPSEVRGKQIISLDVPDLYSFMQPELIDLLTKKLKPFLAPAVSKRGRL
jgi:predicted protein tyrosine phosphatase